MITLDKTNYLNYCVCARYGWQRYHKKISDSETKRQLYQQGYQVENLAKQLFPGGHEISGERQKALERTRICIEKNRSDILYQATALTPGKLLAKADIITIDEKQELDLYEVKMANNVGLDPNSKKDKDKKERYLNDIAFQKIVFTGSGYKINRTFLVHINKNFCLRQEIVDPHKFFNYIDVSDLVERRLEKIKAAIRQVQLCYSSDKEPDCKCFLKPKTKRCPAFIKFNPQIPEKNSIFDIHNIRIEKIKPLYQAGILKIGDITAEIRQQTKFNPKQLNHIQVVQTQQPIIDQQKIAHSLDKLQKPFYFLDYEAINYPIPIFQNAGPFQQIPFQFSLFILNDEKGEPLHKEYLMQAASEVELKRLIECLQNNVGSHGSIIVWHQPAEIKFQKNLISLYPESAGFFEDLNQRIFDLEKVFTNQYYVHPDFEGKTSLKNVLPVLVPRLNYSDLNIQEGSLAGRHWDEALVEPEKTKKQMFGDLLKYCSRDTEAMVEIYKFLNGLQTEG